MAKERSIVIFHKGSMKMYCHLPRTIFMFSIYLLPKCMSCIQKHHTVYVYIRNYTLTQVVPMLLLGDKDTSFEGRLFWP